MKLTTLIAVPLLLLTQGFNLVVNHKNGEPTKIQTENIETMTFSDSDKDSYGLIVTLKNGDKKEFILSKKPTITFEDEECVIDSEGFKTYIPISDIDFGSFGEVNSGSGIVEASENTVRLDLSDPQTAVVSGIAPGSQVGVYSIDGIRIQMAEAGSDGAAYLDLSQISRGNVFIISVNSVKNFKIYKK